MVLPNLYCSPHDPLPTNHHLMELSESLTLLPPIRDLSSFALIILSLESMVYHLPKTTLDTNLYFLWCFSLLFYAFYTVSSILFAPLLSSLNLWTCSSFLSLKRKKAFSLLYQHFLFSFTQAAFFKDHSMKLSLLLYYPPIHYFTHFHLASIPPRIVKLLQCKAEVKSISPTPLWSS